MEQGGQLSLANELDGGVKRAGFHRPHLIVESMENTKKESRNGLLEGPRRERSQ